jgi:hypothetical protein
MKSWIRNITLASLMLASGLATAAAPQDLTGMWQGKLAVDPKNSLTIQMTFSKDAKGAYTAVLNSPDNPAIKNTAATGVTWDGTTLKLQVPTLQGSYAGTLKDGALNGQWTQPGGNLPLVLAPYQKPVVTKQAAAQLIGAWFGPITVAGSAITVQFRFSNDAKGELQGTFSIPDRGLNDSPVSDLEFTGGKLSLRIPQVNNAPFTATLANNQLTGAIKIPAPGAPPDGIPLVLKKGEYAAPVHALKLTSEQYAALGGKWNGKLEITAPDGQKRTLTLVMRFETNAAGQYVGFLDSPDQKATGIPITEATFVDGTLTVQVELIKGTYTGKLAGKTLTGTWSQGPGTNPLVLTRQ